MAQYFSTYWLRLARNNSISGVISHIIGLLATPSEKNLVPCPNMNILKVMWNRNFITIFYNGTFFVKKQKNVHSLDFTDGTTVSRRGNCKVRNTSPVASQIQRFRNCLSGWWCWSNNLSAPFFFSTFYRNMTSFCGTTFSPKLKKIIEANKKYYYS